MPGMILRSSFLVKELLSHLYRIAGYAMLTGKPFQSSQCSQLLGLSLDLHGNHCSPLPCPRAEGVARRLCLCPFSPVSKHLIHRRNVVDGKAVNISRYL